MRLRVIHAPDAREAISRVRADLGDDAMVLATRQTESGVSVTAAVEVSAEDDLSMVLAPADDHGAKQEIDEALAWHAVPLAVRAALLGTRTTVGGDGAFGRLADLLSLWARFAPLRPAPGERLMLIGPHGAGKTAAAARLAVEAALAGAEYRLVCADASRAAAAVQLQALLAPLGRPPDVVGNVGELAACLDGESRPCIIDTSGLNPFRGEELARIADLVHAARAEPVIVIPAGLAAEDAAEMVANFAALGAKRMIVSKLDGARRLGGMLAASAVGLAFAGATIAPEIGRPVMPLTAAGLARLLLRQQPSARVA